MDISNATALASAIVALVAVVGVSQAVYVLVNQAFGGKLSKDRISD